MVKKQLSCEQRNLIVHFIFVKTSTGKPPRGRMKEAEQKFEVSRSCIHRLWKSAKQQQQRGQPIHIVSGNKSRKRRLVHQPDASKIQAQDLSDRTTYERMAKMLGVSPSTLCRWKKIRIFRAHTSTIKPSLTTDNKFIMLRFSLESLELDKILNKLRFQNMKNVVHIDEKWFYITKGSNRYYIIPDEEEPYRATQSKKIIGKIMFMCAVNRPILNEDGTVLFDGKIGIFPFIEQVPAVRHNRNMPRGTLETKAIKAITRDVIRNTIIHKILPAIREKWPQNAGKTIYIHQDNAKPHITNSDPEFRAEADKEGFNITLVQQPPNSPNCSVNDLGWFNDIQSLQQQRVYKSVDDLVSAVVQSFYELQPHTLNNVFISLQCVLTEIMKCKGHNNYKATHMGNDALINARQPPDVLEVPLDLAMECIKYLVRMAESMELKHSLVD